MDNRDMQAASEVGNKRQNVARPLNGWLLLFILFFWFVFSFRLISLPLLLLVVWFSRPKSNRFLCGLFWLLFIVASLSPIDIRVSELSSSHIGKPQARIGLVRYIVGMPARTCLLTRYGEFYSGGCSGPCVYSPRYVLSFSIGGIATNPQSDQERLIASEIRNHHGTFEVDETAPGKPVAIVRLWPNDSEDITQLLEHFKDLNRLQQLELWGDKITDTTLEYVERLTQLQALRLYGDQITDAGLVHLKGLIQLQELQLSVDHNGGRITDSGLEHLERLTQLQKLILSGSRVSDTGLRYLKNLTQLRDLSLSGDQITDSGLESLKRLTQLEKLGLYDTQITKAGLTHLGELTQLRELDIGSNQLTDSDLTCLRELAALRRLWISSTKVTDAGIEKLQRALPNCSIQKAYIGIGNSKR